jgi:hypothetical protein
VGLTGLQHHLLLLLQEVLLRVRGP